MRSLLAILLCCAPGSSATTLEAAARPNILWLSAEDISPDLGCYGDPYARTPHLDRFAASGVRYTHCFTHAGVCAPSRSGLITGMYPPSIGTQHMRCQGVPPDEVRCFPEYLRSVGYYCTNNAKTDYQFAAPPSAWDENSNTADWKGRKPGQPFFCVINFTTTHESQIRAPGPATKKLVAALPTDLKHDPAQAIVPAYYPDTPRVRQDLANYADNISALDQQVGQVLARLERDGLADDTIVWFWGDHGRGLPRAKRWLYDSGTRAPLLIRVPEKWRPWVGGDHPELVQPGSVNDQLVAFVDFAPTILSLADFPIPGHLQGQAFLGPSRAPQPRQYVYGHRDRMDEAYDLIRMVRDERFKYLRNFRPEMPYSQDIAYMNEMPTMQELRRLHAAGELTPAAKLFFRPEKPVEELFDTQADPDELHNLADDPRYAAVLGRMRTECERWMIAIGDTGLIPEPLLEERQRPGNVVSTASLPPLTISPLENGQLTITVPNQIPGVSLVYQISPAGMRVKPRAPWQLLTTQPITVQSGDSVHVKACRIGFRDSESVTWIAGEEPPPALSSRPVPPHWRAALDQSGLIAKLIQLKAWDRAEDDIALAAQFAALSDPAAEVRYWALHDGARRLSARSPDDPARDRWVAAVQRLRREDPVPLLQIEAARTLAAWGPAPAEIQFLAESLQQPGPDSLKLMAAIALRDLAEQARPLRPQIEAASQQGEYVGRVCQGLIELWDHEAP